MKTRTKYAIAAGLALTIGALSMRRRTDAREFRFVDGARVARTARLDGARLHIGTTPPIVVEIDRHPSGQPGRAASGPHVGIVAYAILALFRDVWRAPVGTRLGVTIDDHKMLAIFEVHPADASKPFEHPGVGMRELAG